MLKKFQELIEIINEKSHNTLLLSDHELIFLFQNFAFLTNTVKNAIISESLCRYWLYQKKCDNTLLAELKKYISPKDIDIFWNETGNVRKKIQLGLREIDQNNLPFDQELNEQVINRLEPYYL